MDATTGDGAAQLSLEICCCTGNGVQDDIKRETRFLRKAAAQTENLVTAQKAIRFMNVTFPAFLAGGDKALSERERQRKGR